MTDREKLKVFFEKKSVYNKNKNYFFVALARKKRDYILKNVRKSLGYIWLQRLGITQNKSSKIVMYRF